MPAPALDREWTHEEGIDAYDALVLGVPRAYTALHAYLHAARSHAMTFLDPTFNAAWPGLAAPS